MITRIEVDGFKSLRGFALDLEPLTAIVGPNGAGKSNLLDALHLLSRLAQTSATEALKGGRGAIRDQFSRLRDGAAGRIRIGVEMLLVADRDASQDQLATRYWYTAEIERVALSSGIEDITLEEHSDVIDDPAVPDTWMARHPALARHGDPAGKVKDRALKLRRIEHELSAIRVVQFEPSRLRLPSERAAGAALAADGSNLPTALAALAPAARAQIRADLAELIPGFRSFEVVPLDEELRLEVEFTDGARVPARVLSDGTLRLIALLTLLRGSPPGALIAVEEPENGIYPGRLRALIDKLVDATTPEGDVLPPQVLLTSHSPALVAALHGRSESLVFADLVRRGDDLRSTRMRHVRAADGPERDPGTVSRREIERILDAARPEDEA
ncbi:ATP-binding protein [Sorangium sp. So ce448]|uniref:AAA family ATPase n=1 Tax=Sorangium sp. So ce448 TaxID=3133314 RepID=UPI003F645A96